MPRAENFTPRPRRTADGLTNLPQAKQQIPSLSQKRYSSAPSPAPSEGAQGGASEHSTSERLRNTGERIFQHGSTLETPAELLTVHEAARYLRLSKSFLDKARLYGGGPEFVRLGRKILYRRRDIDDWVRQHRYRSTSEYPDE